MPNYPQAMIIRRLFSKGQPLAFSKGEIVLGNDSSPDGIYYISSGYVKVYSVSDDGEEFVHIIYGAGELFPLIWGYIDVQSSSLFFETLSDVVVWRISKEWFNVFAQRDTEFAFAMSQQLAWQFQVYSDRVDNLEYKRASDRVIYRLLFLASRFGAKDDEGYTTIRLPITHELFAHTINLARESVSREFERLEADRLIRQQGRTMQLLKVKELASRLSKPVNLENWHIF